MNLYKMNVRACGPKSSHESIQAYLIAVTDRDAVKWVVAAYMDSAGEDYEPEEITIPKDRKIPGEYTSEIRMYEYSEDDYESTPETFEDAVLLTGGDPREHDDYYYGVEIYSWECHRSGLSVEQVGTLLDLGVTEITDSAKNVFQLRRDQLLTVCESV